MPDPVNEIVAGYTREQWLDRLTNHFAAMRCSMWGRAHSNWTPHARRANAEIILGIVRSALGYEDIDDAEFAEYVEKQREVVFTITWQPGKVADQTVIDKIAEAHDNLIDALDELGAVDLSGGGTIVRADGSWPAMSEGDGS
jgi:hypothetical protein